MAIILDAALSSFTPDIPINHYIFLVYHEDIPENHLHFYHPCPKNSILLRLLRCLSIGFTASTIALLFFAEQFGVVFDTQI